MQTPTSNQPNLSHTYGSTIRVIDQAGSIHEAISLTIDAFKVGAKPCNRTTWQGVSVDGKPDMQMFELCYVYIDAPLHGVTELPPYQEQIKPNLPWADDHFAERVGGHPLNPGEQWKHWPWGHSADKFRLDNKSVGDPGPERVFDHTYMQRYWPRFAGIYQHGIVPPEQRIKTPRYGIYFQYGDLNDVVDELAADPGTRQAILPVFFPEDTGYRPNRRKPCSLFYHFQLRAGGHLDVVYSIRSCDIVRHFRDDIYLTVRLLLWVLERLRKKSRLWYAVNPGRFIMSVSNLHCFVNDWRTL